MAHMDQNKKAAIAAELRKVIPSNWKWRLSVHDKMTIRLTILSAPADLFDEHKRACEERRSSSSSSSSFFQHRPVFDPRSAGCFSPSASWIKEEFVESRELFAQIVDALNFGNHDHSDSQNDHFDVGHYIAIRVGVSREKPFIGGAQWEAQELAKAVKQASRRTAAPGAAPAACARRL